MTETETETNPHPSPRQIVELTSDDFLERDDEGYTYPTVDESELRCVCCSDPVAWVLTAREDQYGREREDLEFRTTWMITPDQHGDKLYLCDDCVTVWNLTDTCWDCGSEHQLVNMHHRCQPCHRVATGVTH